MLPQKLKLSIFKRAFKKDINIARVGFVALVLLLIFSVFTLNINFYKSTADFVSVKFQKRDSILAQSIYADTSKSLTLKKLREQYSIIAETKQSYLYMANRFNSNGYTFTIFFAFFSIVSGILGFLLLKKGWDGTENFYLKAGFLIAFFCSTLFGVLPSVFNTKENTKSNLQKYNYLSGLQLDIYDLVRDNKGYIKRNTAGSLDSLNKDILAITKGIKDNLDLFFDTNIEKVPTDIKPLK